MESRFHGFCYQSGEGGIRTHDTVSRIQPFQGCSFGHSDTSPKMEREFTLKLSPHQVLFQF
jgi:hypothetical protein